VSTELLKKKEQVANGRIGFMVVLHDVVGGSSSMLNLLVIMTTNEESNDGFISPCTSLG
jgi:hypothetical protein